MNIDKKLTQAHTDLQNELVSVKARMKNLIGNVYWDADNILKKVFYRRKWKLENFGCRQSKN